MSSKLPPLTPALVIRYRLEWLLFSATCLVFGAMGVDIASRLANAYGKVLGRLVTGLGDAERNIAIGLPELGPQARRKLASDHAGCVARAMIEYLHVHSLLSQPNRFTIHGAEQVERVQRSGRGAIYATAHYGNPEVCRVVLSILGSPPALLYRPPNNPYIRRTIHKIAGQIGMPLFIRGVTRPRVLREYVESGGSLFLMTDQRPYRGPILEFLGAPARTATGPATLARSAGVPLIPVRAVRQDRRPLGFDVIFESPVEPGTSANMVADLNARFGTWIRERPEQWLWLHNRWRGTATPPAKPGTAQGS